MKLFWMKNKVLLATLGAMLALGVVFWGGLRLFEGRQMQDTFVRTAFAEAEATITPRTAGDIGATPQPVATAAPTAIPATQAEELQWQVVEREWGPEGGAGRAEVGFDPRPPILHPLPLWPWPTWFRGLPGL